MRDFAKVVARKSGKSLASKSELAELAALDREWSACLNAVNVLYSPAAAKAHWLRQSNEHTGKLRQGEAIARSYSREDLDRDYAERRANAKAGMIAAARQAGPLCARITERFLVVVEKTLEEIESAEVADYKDWNLSYTPTPKVLQLRTLKDSVRANIPLLASSWARPSESLYFLDL